ncbi:MAG: hypothetical protein ACJAXA_000073, partial [Candidatus Aldehydirespiratoraceae bacterium]
VDNSDRSTALYQRINEVRSDERRASSHEDRLC